MLGNILGGGFDVARQALDGLSRRQTAISANIANIDTPGYRRREVEFENALQAQIGLQPTRLAVTDERHFTKATPGDPGDGSATRARDVVSERNDQNDVSIDEEMMLMVDTQLRYQALSQTTGRRLSTLRSVIRGG